MSDLAKELRGWAQHEGDAVSVCMRVAADEIERLRKNLSDAKAAVDAIIHGKPGFDLPSLQSGLGEALAKQN